MVTASPASHLPGEGSGSWGDAAALRLCCCPGRAGGAPTSVPGGTGQLSSSMDTATTVLKKTTALIKTIPSCCPGTKAKPRRNRVRKRCYSCSEPRKGLAVVTGQVQGTGRHQGEVREFLRTRGRGRRAPAQPGPALSGRAGGRQPPCKAGVEEAVSAGTVPPCCRGGCGAGAREQRVTAESWQFPPLCSCSGSRAAGPAAPSRDASRARLRSFSASWPRAAQRHPAHPLPSA